MLAQPAHEDSSSRLTIFRRANAWIFDRTVAIYTRVDDGNPVMTGSGVLLRIADAAFLVSASHVLQVAEHARLLLAPMVDQSRFIPVSGAAVACTRDQSDVDLGFILLPEEVRCTLERNKKFLRLCELDLSAEPSSGFYSVVGYPQKTNTPNYATKHIDILPFCYGTELCRDTADGTPGVSIIVACTKDSLWTFDGIADREKVRMPDLRGISGCGIWQLYSPSQVSRLSQWEPTSIRLAGIQHGVCRSKWIKGTIVRHLITFIGNIYQDLRRSIELSLPSDRLNS